jgi:hypothetical protein
MFAEMTHAHSPPLFRDWTCGPELTEQPPLVLKSCDLVRLQSPARGSSKPRISFGIQKAMIEETSSAGNIRVKPTAPDHLWVLSAC